MAGCARAAFTGAVAHGGIQHSLKNHNGKGVQNVAEGKPAKWKLKEAAEAFGF
jgi:hypothetical protein